jgi:hypothetical protein
LSLKSGNYPTFFPGIIFSKFLDNSENSNKLVIVGRVNRIIDYQF